MVGIGDMAEDVFGNGMLLSRTSAWWARSTTGTCSSTRTPDPERSFEERKRLFELPGSSWADYDPGESRREAAFTSAQPSRFRCRRCARRPLAWRTRRSPNELIQALLRAIDLLWNGGIGTYVKASFGAARNAGDKANDAVRVDASELRAQVIGEGGNLGVTQAGRGGVRARGRAREHRRDRQLGRGRLLGSRGEHQDPAGRRGRGGRPPRSSATRCWWR